MKHKEQEQYDPQTTMLALNMALVSVKRILMTQDRAVLDEEYRCVINNLRMGDIKADADLIELYSELISVIGRENNRRRERQAIDASTEEQKPREVKKLVLDNSTSSFDVNPIKWLWNLMQSCLSDYFIDKQKDKEMRENQLARQRQLQKDELEDYQKLQKKFFGIVPKLLKRYDLPDKYRLTENNIEAFFSASAESEASRRWEMLRDRELEDNFYRYPPYWFFRAQAAQEMGNLDETRACFDKFDEVWRPVLRKDSCKLEAAKFRFQELWQKQPMDNLAMETKQAMLEQLDLIRENTPLSDWPNNLFIGTAYCALDKKDEGISLVKRNINFGYETELSSKFLEKLQQSEATLLPLLESTLLADMDTSTKDQIDEENTSININETTDGDIEIEDDTEQPQPVEEKAETGFSENKAEVADEEFTQVPPEVKSSEITDEEATDEPTEAMEESHVLSEAEQSQPIWNETEVEADKNKTDDNTIMFTSFQEESVSVIDEEMPPQLGKTTILNKDEKDEEAIDESTNGSYEESYAQSGAEQLQPICNETEIEADKDKTDNNTITLTSLEEKVSVAYEEMPTQLRKTKNLNKAVTLVFITIIFVPTIYFFYLIGHEKSTYIKLAKPVYMELSEQGQAEVQFNQAKIYIKDDDNQNDELAVSYFHQAAQRGHADAQNNLGRCYELGIGIDKDEKQAVYWYHEAAKQGHAAAQNSLGEMYYLGKGVPDKDVKQAATWYYRAADQGYADAQYNIGVCYENGDGVKKNRNQAIFWYRKAAAQGHKEAQNALKALGFK